MQSTDRERRTFDLLAAAALAIVAALFPLTSADLWWHLAAGRAIWEGGGIPFADPFSFASDRGMWLDHGWLFQAIVYPLHAIGGAAALQVLQLLLAFGIAFVALRQLARDGVSREIALLAVAVAMATAKPRLTLRPELVTCFFLVVLLVWLRRERPPLVAMAALSLLWANIHPGAILGALIVVIWSACRTGNPAGPGPAGLPALHVLAFCGPLIITPYGLESILFPFRLRTLVAGGGFTNPEWLPATFSRLPLLYVLLAGTVIVLITRKPPIARLLIIGLLAYLAVRYQRNVGVFAVALPILIGPELAALRFRRIALAAAAVIAAYALFTYERPGAGINRREIPVDAVDYVQKAGVRGNMFNQARFGGYLIWKLYPPQKVLIDGRNEVYTQLLPKLASAVGDGRQWRSFLRDEHIEWAIISYDNPPQRVGNGELQPFGYLHFPPNEWALVYWDDVAMVLVRRGGVNAHLERDAPRYLWPENVGFAAARIRAGVWPRGEVAKELEAAIARRPDVSRAYALADVLRGQ